MAKSEAVANAPEPDAGTGQGLIAIVGDWVVDEYWFVDQHRSQISSHTGFVHYRIATEETDEIIDLCGAGHVARVLANLNQEHNRYRITCIGNWADADTELIRHLLYSRGNPACRANAPGFVLSRKTCSQTHEVPLVSLTPDGPTTRVVRLYKRGLAGIEQVCRIDWESPPKEPTDGKKPPRLRVADLGLTPAPLDPRPIIAVNDLKKGVVDRMLIEGLLQFYPTARWCVRTKDREPDWLDLIKDNLDLWVVGPEIAESLNPWGSWIVNGRPTRQAMDVLSTLPGRNVVLLSEQREVVAHLGDDKCVTAMIEGERSPLNELGVPTAIFAALVHLAFDRPEARFEPEDIELAIRTAGNLSGVPLADKLGTVAVNVRPKISSWQDEKRAWRASREELGLITDGVTRQLEAWRGAAIVPGYIACIRRKEETLAELAREIRAFRNQRPRHAPLSILLHADPGAGKTYLAKKLAESFDLAFLRFDITQMLHRDDLLELFDAVATRQANDSSDLLVFVDEINAEIDSSPVYGAFLSPLEEGYYVRKGSSFSLRPCVWVFAGTGEEKKEMPRASKFSDFESRMSLVKRIDFRSLAQEYRKATDVLQGEARLEQVYLGVAMIHRYFPDVTKISEAVLNQFYRLDPERSPARTIRRLCRSLRDVQYGKVSKRNCEEWRVDWGDAKEKRFVRVEF